MPSTTAAAEPAVDGAGHRARRILAVGNMYPPHHAGGYEIAWQQAMRHARAEGHDVRIVVSDYVDDARAEEDPDVHRTLRWYWDLRRYEFPRLSLAQRVRLERHNASELRRHLREFRPDVVAWWSMGCMSLSLIEQVRRAGIPSAFVVHDDWLVYGWQRDAWLRLWRDRRRLLASGAQALLGLPTQVRLDGRFVFNSDYTLRRARQAGIDAPGARVVHPGVDQRFLEAPLEPAPWRWRLACIGRLDPQKGVDTAVSALAELPPEATLTIWGSGDQEYVARTGELARELGVEGRVRFAGFVSGDELRDAYAQADAILFPVRWEEPFGLVPLEAMALGLPVVSTARGGSAEFLRDGENALVFAAGDAGALAAQVRRLAASDALRARLRQAGLATAGRFTAARFARETVAEIVSAAR